MMAGTGLCRRLALAIAVLCAIPTLTFGQQRQTGLTQAVHDLDLALPVAGQVEEILVAEGDDVEAGKLLVVLDSELERLDLERRRLRLEDTARLEEARRTKAIRKKQLAEAERLRETNSISQMKLQEEKLAYVQAQAEYRVQQRQQEIQRVQRDLAREALERRTLRAPRTGTIARLMVEVGESVRAHETVVNLVDTATLHVEANVEPATASRLQVGQDVTLQFDQLGGLRRDAKVAVIAPGADPGSGLVRTRLTLPNEDGAVMPGLRARLLLSGG